MPTRLKLPRETQSPPRHSGPSAPAARDALLAALDDGPHAVALFDAADRLVYANPAFRSAWQTERDCPVTFNTMIRNGYFQKRGPIVVSDDIEAWLVSARRRRRAGPSSRSFEVDLWDGRWFWVSERRLDDGWLLTVAQDITALKDNEHSLAHARDSALQASLTDPLTQLPNRRGAMQYLETALARGDPFYLAIIDIDHFKQINDQHGHAAGDAVLVSLANRITQLHQRAYLGARLAGDEFCVFSAPGESRTAFEQALTALIDVQPPAEECVAFSISIGAASFPADGSDIPALLPAADAALYDAKTSGRRTVRFRGG